MKHYMHQNATMAAMLRSAEDNRKQEAQESDPELWTLLSHLGSGKGWGEVDITNSCSRETVYNHCKVK